MQLIKCLGYAGLLPFAVLPLAYHMQWLPVQWLSGSTQLLQLYQYYSALILGFMAGVLWPVLYQPAGKQSDANTLALLAVSFPVISIICLALLPDYFLPLQALLFLLLRLAEFHSGINQRYGKDYRTLRNALTLVVVVSHVVMFALIQLAAA
ncbi:DUF3429 family protein [Arsukibacterium indicum]|uniref:DUF3429 domain-containing protein n=1 Tax=Arsukibacterium indicum TaxID=2848612 RepID=A0ABS6MIQ7_9GAMM|nr:DUF3429 family protein [Arsukibacterium indicum]MBV2128694.1 DUF3429 domain-containing protein [Arsukibacterium indicum]